MGPATLRLSGVSRTFARTVVLNDLTLVAEPGLITVILGPSGSGKSALMRILAGFDRPQAGTIELDGRDIAGLAAHRRRFGVVQQPDLLFPHLSVADNVGFPLLIRRSAAANRTRLVAATLDQLLLSHVAASLPSALTEAEYQRAVLARATVCAPRLLLLDEPFSQQDPTTRPGIIDSLRRIHELIGTTTLLATDCGPDALALADRLVVLRDGAVVQHGSPAAVFDRPANDHVAALLGDCNRLPGRVDKLDDDLAIVRLACGPVVEAVCGTTLQRGQPCMLTVRPDRIAIAAMSAADMGDRAIDATVLDIRFLGSLYRLRLLIGSGTELVVTRPVAAGLRDLAPGSAAAIAWQPHHASAFMTEAAKAAPD